MADVCFVPAATILLATIVVATGWPAHAQSPADANERRDNPPLAAPNAADPAVEAVAPFAATPMVVVDEVLKLARVGTNDFVTDIREATVVTVYLLPIAMNRLQAKLLAELAPGTRVVSHDYPFRSWPADRVVALDVPEKSDYTGRRSTSIYLYTVPARAPR